MPVARDLTNLKFGKLTVIKLSPQETTVNKKWLCICDCGKEKVVLGFSLVTGGTKSCGCLYSRLPPGGAAKNKLFDARKRDALKRLIAFELTKEEFFELTQQPCHYCDQIPAQTIACEFAHGAFIYNGVDRVDNNYGYTINNCVACCKACNYAKHMGTAQDYIARSIRIAKKWSK